MKLRMILIIVPVVLATTGTFSVFAKTPFNELTSDSKAQEVADKVPRVTSNINVHSVGVGVGQTILIGDFKDYADDAINMDLFYNYSASYSFDMLINYHYSKHSFKTEEVTLPGLAIGIKAKLWNFDSFSPFVLGGFGFYSPKVKRIIHDQLEDSRTRITFGYHLGGGAELDLNRNFSMALMGHLHNPFQVKQEIGGSIKGWYFKMMVMGFYRF